MTYCISDIHGAYGLFMRLMEHIGYSDSDRLIVCGDFVDKGKDSVRLAKTLFAMPEAYCLAGNHEHTFFQFYRTRMHSAIMDFDAILWHLQQYFPEIDRFFAQCRFTDCKHIKEPGCVVREAVERGEIAKSRYESYCMLYEEVAAQKLWK